jgi:hypothetical protein
VLRTHDLEDIQFLREWDRRIDPLNTIYEQHIYHLDSPDHKLRVRRLSLDEIESNHQDNQFGIRKTVTERDNELHRSNSGHDPRSDPNYATALSLESASVRNSNVVIDEPDARGGVSRMPESHQYLTNGTN